MTPPSFTEIPHLISDWVDDDNALRGSSPRPLAERLAIAATQPKVIFETMSVPHLAPRLVELDLPVLGLWGVDDQFCPVEGAMTLARNIKRCRVTLFSQCGHWVMVEHPRNFERLVLDFLAEP